MSDKFSAQARFSTSVRVARIAAVVLIALSVSGLANFGVEVPGPTLREQIIAHVFAQGPGALVDPCPGAATTRTYNVVAVQMKVVYNHFGDHDREGRLLLRSDELAALQGQLDADPWDVAPLQAPLVLRANVGDCVVINLENRLNLAFPGKWYDSGSSSTERVGLHVHGVIAKPGSGVKLGNNADDTIAPGATRQYVFYIPDAPGMEGAHFMHSHDRFQHRHGLFGAVVAEPAGATWLKRDGTPSLSGTQAIIVQPGASDFREYVTMYHDEIGEGPQGLFELTSFGSEQMPQVSEFGEYGPGTKGINLRSEPFRTRFLETEDQLNRHDKSQAYGSYTHGDPGADIPLAYVGDPTKFRMCGAGPGQHHLHHLHGGGDRWRFSPVSDDTQFDDVAANGFRPIKFNPILRSNSDRIDVESMGPGECFNQEIEGGAGGVQMAVGDFLFHCHIVEHYVSGMMSFWRVFNTLQPGLAELPDYAGRIKPAVNSLGLIGKTLPDGTVLDATNIRPWIESHLPDRGVRANFNDASAWDWAISERPQGPLYLGEPETASVWANFPADAPGRLPAGTRPELLFDETNGRLAYPHLRPHLGMRPPFAPGHGPAPYLTQTADARHPDGLCPATAPVRHYDIVAIRTPVAYNAQDTDSGGLIFVHAADKAAVLAGTKPAKSFVIRANQGECVEIIFTNQIPSSAGEGKVNMHIHLVNFDPQASDGVITGLQYEQSIRPATETGTTLASPVPPIGATSFNVASGAALRVGTTVCIGCTEPNVEIRKIVAITGNTVTVDAPLAKAHVLNERIGPEFVRYAWYADVDLGVVYWHDHVDGLAGWRRGLFASIIIEPAGSRWCDPKRATGGPCSTDVLDGHVLDIVNTDPSKQADKTYTFREAVVQIQENGGPDGEWASLNLRNAPFGQRFSGNPLSSSGNGDPATDVWRTYPGDSVQVRLIYTGQGEDDTQCSGFCLDESRGANTFAVTGHRFGFEQFNPNSRLVDRLSTGIARHFNPYISCAGGGPVLGTGNCARQAGDYLYYMTQPDFFARGAWGILRVYGTQQTCPGTNCLQPLPSNTNIAPAALPTGPVRSYEIVAMNANVKFNVGESISQSRAIFALKSEEAAINAGTLNPQPLVIRALPGETVEIKLTNRLSDKVTIHPTMLLCNPANSYGIPVGNNPTGAMEVGNGQTKTFQCFADREATGYLASFGTGTLPREAGDDGSRSSSFEERSGPLGPALDLLRDLMGEDGDGTGDPGPEPMSHDGGSGRDDKLYGSIIVEPAGSSFAPATGTTSTLTIGGSPRKEFVLFYESEDSIFDASVMPYNDFPTEGSDRDNANNLINFRTEPLTERNFNVDPDSPLPSGVFASAGFGDPETPLLTARKGTNVVVRTLGGASDQLAVQVLEGHWWKRDPAMTGSNVVDFATVGVGETSDAWIDNVGQGGTGDYFYGNHRDAFTQVGQWGIFRVTA